MKSSNINSPKHPNKWRWFIGMYFASLVIVGGAMYLVHVLAFMLMKI